ncbi:MAG: deoxyribose-phosphate aldolase, partial [Cytophagaceae bacterium]
RTLEGLLQVKAMGVSRLGASATAAIMQEAYRQFGDGGTSNVPAPDNGETKGY